MKLIFIGPPSAGKGTYAKKIGPHYGIPHISTGDMLRAEVAKGSAIGQEAQGFMEAGKLVPDNMIIEMVKERMQSPDAAAGFILDGFPRNIAQAEELKKMSAIDAVLYIKMPEDILVKKVLARRVCQKCGELYNVVDIDEQGIRMPGIHPQKPGICDKCGGKIEQRSDDNAATFSDRLKIYHEQCDPVVAYYQEQGLVKEFKPSGPPEEMTPQIIALLEK